MREIEVVAGVIRRQNRVLICSRPQGKPPYGWEFPGGKCEKSESLNQALVRELKEELALEAVALDQIFYERVVKTDVIINLHFIRCIIAKDAVPVPQEGQECQFVPINQLLKWDILPADINFVRFLWQFD